MSRYLCISVTLLDCLFHGTGDDGEPEWPPSPMRLYQALLAGSHAGCRNDDWSEAKTHAFYWLERRKPPVIITPAIRKSTAYTLFVPNNDSDKKLDRQERLTSKIARPHQLIDGDIVYYLWSIDESEWDSARPHVESICQESRHLMALGWGIDQVVGNGRILSDAEAAALQGQHWHPWEDHWPGQRLYRVPQKGSLEDLEQVHKSFLGRVEGNQYRPSRKHSKFNTVAYLRETEVPPRPYAVFELPDGIAFRQEDTVKAAAMLRSLACKLSQNDTHQFPGGSEPYVAGHMTEDDRGHPRFSYLPLPTIGHAHADGMVRRLLIAEPFGGNGSHAHWAKNRLRNAVLKDHDGNERAMLLDLWRPESKKMIRRYVEPNREWCSVTPVILPGYDDFNAIAYHDEKRPTKAERLLFKCLMHAGLTPACVESVTMRRAPFWLGSQYPRQYHRPNYLADQHSRPGWHVRLVLRERVPGPLAIGAGRHCGLGIFAAIEK